MSHPKQLICKKELTKLVKYSPQHIARLENAKRDEGSLTSPDYPDTSSWRHKCLILLASVIRAGGSDGAQSSAVSKRAAPGWVP